MGTADRPPSRQFVGRYICIDPGEDTGFSLLEVKEVDQPVQLVDYCTINYTRHGPAKIRKTLCELYYYGMDPTDGFGTAVQARGLNTVILEKFVHRPGRPFNPIAYKVMGVCEGWHEDFRDGGDPMFQYIERTPVQGKSEADNTVLKRLGMYLPRHEQRHMNDATRHGVSWLIEKAHRATCLVAKPKDEDE